ncbi:MAG: hybrid sensor histidine kinase/response regulator [Planctomycetota bacterium]|jgi:signal transduction histidine kinase/CheY-like chemotaxis protein
MTRFPPLLLLLLVFAVFSAPVVWVWTMLRGNSVEGQQERLDLTADQAALRLSEFLEGRFLAVRVLQQGMENGSLEEPQAFRAQSSAVQEEFGGFQALNWADRHYNLVWVVPLAGNEGALGKNILDNPIAADTLLKAEATRLPALSTPIDLFQGGRGVVAYFPVHATRGTASETIGFVNAVFRVEDLVEEALDAGLLDLYRLHLDDMEEHIYASVDYPREADALPGYPRAEARLDVLGREWLLRLIPRDMAAAGLTADRHLSLLIGGLLFSLALASSAALLLASRQDAAARRAERRQIERASVQARKMEAVGELAGGVAHDFNNLLTAITGSASLAQADLPSGSPPARQLDRIIDACRRAAEMTARLLTFSRASLVERVNCDAATELETLRELLAPLVREDIAFRYAIHGELGVVALAPSELSQVVLNLVNNAVDALPQGGKLGVDATRIDLPHQGAFRRFLRLTVADDGVGMPEEVVQRMFDPFFTTKEAGRGTGFGLSTVYGLVQRAGGHIEVQSRLGAGTLMQVDLPMVEEAALPAEPAPVVASGRSGRILVVEDEEQVRQVLAEMLRAAGHEVREAVDGEAAFATWQEDPAVDLVLTDAVMPRMGGLELARHLRAAGYGGPLVLCSGYATDLTAEELERQALHFLTKPPERDALLGLVGRLLLAEAEAPVEA